MKYGESTFDILYLLFAVTSGLVILGAVICVLYFKKRGADRTFRFLWLYVLLSFLFYIPVAAAAGIVPMLGMLMLPKTVCYILMIIAFLKAVKKEN